MGPLTFLVALFRVVLTRLRAQPIKGEAGEIVTWIILAAGLAVIALAVVAIIGAKLRSAAENIELE